MTPAHQTTLGLRRQRKVLRSHEAAKGYLIDEIDRRLIARARGTDGRLTTDEAHVVLDEILAEDVELGFPEGRLDRRFLGAVFARSHWRNTGRYVPTRRPERNAARVPTWRLDESKLED